MPNPESHAARHLQFWVAAIVVTAINLSVWILPRPGDGPGVGPESSGRITPVALRVRQATTASQFERDGIFNLRLDRAAFGESSVGRAIERPPFRFEPTIEGGWEVVDEDLLTFVPSSEIGAGRVFRVVPDRSHPLWRVHELDESSLPVLRYRPLTIESMSLRDVDLSEGESGHAVLRIEFNQPVRRSDLLEHLSVELDGKAATLDDAFSPTAERHDLEVAVVPGGQLTVAIAPELHGEDDLLGLDRDVRRRFEVSGRLVDLRAWGYGDWYRDPEGRDRTIRIEFDRTLAEGQSPTVRVEPDPGPVRIRTWRDQVVVSGAFDTERAYKVTVDGPLLGVDRSVLTRPVVRSVRIPGPPAMLDFEPYKGQVVPGGRFEIGLRHSGHRNARIRIHRLVDAHVPMVLGEFINDYQLPSASELAYDDIITLPEHEGGHGTTMLDLERFIERRPGLYRIDARATDDSWDNDTAILMISDLALDLQRSGDATLAWVTSIESGSPVEGVEVATWAPNITETWSGTTDEDGVVLMPVSGEAAHVVTARIGDDLVFARSRRARGLEDRDLAGAPWTGPMDAALYPERGVHRPGEQVHLSAIVRTRTGDPVVDTPFEVRWIRPDGRVDRTVEIVTDPVQGWAHVDLPTEPSDPTGRWIAAIHLPGAAESIARIECPIMPFLPVRLRVEATAEEIEAGAAIEVDTTTTYLHGAPAAGLSGTVTARFTPTTYTDDRFPEFTFEPRRRTDIVRQEVEIVLDGDGRAVSRMESPSTPATWNLLATVSTRELGGRSTSATVERRIDTQPTHLGLRLPEGRIHLPGAPVPVEAAVVVDGAPATNLAPTWTLSRIERDWSYERVDGRWRWLNDERLHPVSVEPVVEIGADRLLVELPGLEDGEYRLVASLPVSDAPNPTTIDFHVSRWQTAGRMNVERSDRIELVPDVETVAAGATLPILVRSPFPGTALVTFETDRTIDHRLVEVAGDGVRIECPVPIEARDTAFVSATLVRPLDSARRSWAPLLARGATRVRIDRTPHLLEPEIEARSQARPGDRVRTTISIPDASADAMVHLWAVEEGALLPTDHHAENPADHLLRDRRRVVETFSTLVDLLPEYDRTVQEDAIGGDRGASRREPIPVRLPETRVIWRTAERLGEDGVIEADLEMPTLDGAMRLMAVAVDRDRYGAVEHLVGVVPAVQVLAAFPRTAAPGDVMTVPVTLRNNLDTAAEIRLDIEHGDHLDAWPRRHDLALEPGAAEVIDVTIETTGLGVAPIAARATTREADRTIETALDWNVAVRPPFGLERETRRQVVAAGSTVDIERDRRLEGIGGVVEVIVSDGPEADLGPAIEDLVDYPHGCAEQIGSRIEGLLATLLVDPSIGGVPREVVRSMAASGFGRLWTNQRPDGSIPYWSGGEGQDWLTARTAVLALRAEGRDVPLPGTLLPGLLDAAERIASNPKSSRSARVLAARALAEADRLDPAILETIFLERAGLGLGERAHLAVALHRLERPADAASMIEDFAVPSLLPPTDRGRFTSDVTQAAIALAVGLEHVPEASSLPALQQVVAEGLGTRRWRTTYETAAAVEALARWRSILPRSGSASGTVEIAGETIRFSGGDPIRSRIEIDRNDPPRSVERIVSDGDGPLHVTITTRGVPLRSASTEAEHRGLQVERTWFDATGEPIDPAASITPGRTVIVEVGYRSTTGASLPNVAIVDVIPSGFEIELPTLVTAAAGETTIDVVDHVEFRDDRVIVFDTAEPKVQRFRYVVRAVVPGDWIRPGTVGEAMYHDAVRSVLPPDRVEIELE